MADLDRTRLRVVPQAKVAPASGGLEAFSISVLCGKEKARLKSVGVRLRRLKPWLAPALVIALALVFSTRARVFGGVRGLEHWAHEYRLDLRDSAGNQHAIKVTRALVRGLHGSHQKRVFTILPFAFAPVLPPTTATGLLRHNLCNNGVVNASQTQTRLESARIVARHRMTGQRWTFTVRCVQ